MNININWKPITTPPSKPSKRVILTGGVHPTGCDRFDNRHPDRTNWCYRDEIPAPPVKTAVELAWENNGRQGDYLTFKRGYEAATASR